VAFVPAAFSTPVTPPSTYQAYREAPYISPSQYRFSPTSVGTAGLVIQSNDTQADSTASLAQVIARASAWVDDYVFHADGSSLVSSLTVEAMSVVPKPDGSLVLLANLKPIRQLVGLAVGPAPSGLANLDSATAQDIVLGEKTITVPTYGISGAPVSWFGSWPVNAAGLVYCVYSYVAGWPHATLAAPAAAGVSTLQVNPPVAGDTTMWGVLPGTPLTIKDGANTEQVVVTEAPTGLTLTLASPLQYDHTPPPAPDAIMVTALPSSIEEATILITNLLIKTQGFRAQQLPGSIGAANPGQQQAMARSGALSDMQLAEQLLQPYVVTFIHS
jgi:hypothetical protein